ncbi:MAG: GNAT family N-acetyltransferase [Candidatus Vogelbacteria bacterium]|nr:GNAT family N-acetyltransferase [Candidatus Vogelbacteria bacterium]
MNIILRRANIGDLQFLFDLRNEPQVRNVSFFTSSIDLSDHKRWFEKKLSSIYSAIYIATLEDGIPIGQVRYDVDAEDKSVAEVSIALTSNFTGRGLGNKILRNSCLLFFEDFAGVSSVDALIKKDNIASIKSFEKAGYMNLGQTIINNTLCVKMRLRKR